MSGTSQTSSADKSNLCEGQHHGAVLEMQIEVRTFRKHLLRYIRESHGGSVKNIIPYYSSYACIVSLRLQRGACVQHEGSVDSEAKIGNIRKAQTAIPEPRPSRQAGVSPVGLGNTLKLVLFLLIGGKLSDMIAQQTLIQVP